MTQRCRCCASVAPAAAITSNSLGCCSSTQARSGCGCVCLSAADETVLGRVINLPASRANPISCFDPSLTRGGNNKTMFSQRAPRGDWGGRGRPRGRRAGMHVVCWHGGFEGSSGRQQSYSNHFNYGNPASISAKTI